MTNTFTLSLQIKGDNQESEDQSMRVVCLIPLLSS